MPFAFDNLPQIVFGRLRRSQPPPASASSYQLIDQSMADPKDLAIDDGDYENTLPRSARDEFYDPEMEGLSLYEKKALLVNRELDSHGMGRYQWCIFFLCGFGYLIDLLYAQAFVWGVLVDIVGRQYAFNLTVLIAAVFGLCLAAPNTYDGVLVLTAFVGFGIGGNIPIDTTICLEFLPQPIGVVVSSGIAYGFIPQYSCGDDAQGKPLPACSAVEKGAPCCTKKSNMGWRYDLLCLGAITLVVFLLRFVLFNFRESPKFLLYRGQDAKAVQVLQQVAEFNKRECHITLEAFEKLTNEDTSISSRDTTTPILGGGPRQLKASWKSKVMLELQRYKILFASFGIAYLTVLVWIAYMFDYWAFTIAGSFLPTILLEKNSAIKVSIRETYRNFVIIYICGIPGVLLGATMYGVPRVGRKWAMVGSSALMGVSLFLFSTVNTEASNVGLNAMEYFFQSMFNAVLYGWTPEAFPAPIRGTACGLASFWGRLFSIISPLIAAKLLNSSLNGPLYLAGAGAFVSTVAIVLMPTKSMGARSY